VYVYVCGGGQAGLVEESAGAVAAVVKEEGVGGLYTGFSSNVAYAFPADAIKFLVRWALCVVRRSRSGG
jgi:hypothetical protein